MLAKEALFVLGVSRPVLQRLVKNGKIRVVEMESGNKFVYDYNPDDVMTVREEREKAGKSKRFAWRREAVYAVEKLSCEDNDVIGYGSILKAIKNKGDEKKPVSQPASASEEVKKSSADESKDSLHVSETPAPGPSGKGKSGKEKKDVVVDKDHIKKEIGGKTRQVVEMLLQPESKRSPFLQGLIYFLPNKEGVEFDVVNRDKMKEALADEIKKGSIDTYSMVAVSALYKDGGIEKNDKDQFAIKSECNKQLKNSLSKEEYQRIGLTINALNHVDFGDKSDSPALKAFDGYRRSMIDPGFKENKQFDKDMQLIVETEGKVTGSSKAAMRQMEQGLDQGRNFNILNKMASNPELSSLLKGKTIDNLSNSFNKGIDSGLGSVREMEAANDTKAREKEMVGLNKMLDKKREKEMSKSRGKGSIEK